MLHETLCLLSIILAQVPLPTPSIPRHAISFDAAPPAIHEGAKTWPTSKLEYVKKRVLDPSIAQSVDSAAHSSKVELSKMARISLATEYAAAEYDVQQTGYTLAPIQAQQTDIFKQYIMALPDPSVPNRFSFQTTQGSIKLQVPTAETYGRLKISLNPPVDVFTVIIDNEPYDSVDTLVLLVGSYNVVVDRTDDRCEGLVTIHEARTSKFACH
jgi:hypothetical protein